MSGSYRHQPPPRIEDACQQRSTGLISDAEQRRVVHALTIVGVAAQRFVRVLVRFGGALGRISRASRGE